MSLQPTIRNKELSEETKAEIREFIDILLGIDGLPLNIAQITIKNILVEALEKWEQR